MGICGGCLDVGERGKIKINNTSLLLLFDRKVTFEKDKRTDGKNAKSLGERASAA